MSSFAVLPAAIEQSLHEGMVIPAHPLALNADGRLNETCQRQLTRYYLSAGAGGIAVGVHSTQFEIREPQHNLYETVLKMAAEEADNSAYNTTIRIAGICGSTTQAIQEAELAVKHGYHLGLLSLGALKTASEDELIVHVKTIASIIPVFGFYLQPAVGGRALSYAFWRRFADIPGVYAIKIAAFNRYQTLDAIRGTIESDRRNEIALYTGNDDNIVADLLTTFRFPVNGAWREKQFAGGLLGHWAVWTQAAVKLFEEIKTCRKNQGAGMEQLLETGVAVTDMNAALFDVANHFHGCIPGIHEVLFRQGLLPSIRCLNPREGLSVGQPEELERVMKAYPHMTDDAFVRNFLHE